VAVKTELPRSCTAIGRDFAAFDRIALADLLAAWARRGVANGTAVTAGAQLYIIPGHTEHHVNVLRTRYGIGRPSR